MAIPVSGGEDGTLVGSLEGCSLSLVGEDMIKVAPVCEIAGRGQFSQLWYCDSGLVYLKESMFLVAEIKGIEQEGQRHN